MPTRDYECLRCLDTGAVVAGSLPYDDFVKFAELAYGPYGSGIPTTVLGMKAPCPVCSE